MASPSCRSTIINSESVHSRLLSTKTLADLGPGHVSGTESVLKHSAFRSGRVSRQCTLQAEIQNTHNNQACFGVQTKAITALQAANIRRGKTSVNGAGLLLTGRQLLQPCSSSTGRYTCRVPNGVSCQDWETFSFDTKQLL